MSVVFSINCLLLPNNEFNFYLLKLCSFVVKTNLKNKEYELIINTNIKFIRIAVN